MLKNNQIPKKNKIQLQHNTKAMISLTFINEWISFS